MTSYQIVSIDCVPIGIVGSLARYSDAVETLHPMGSTEVIKVPGRSRIEITVAPMDTSTMGRYIQLANQRERKPSEFPANPVENLAHLTTGKPALWLGWLSEQFEDWWLRGSDSTTTWSSASSWSLRSGGATDVP